MPDARRLSMFSFIQSLYLMNKKASDSIVKLAKRSKMYL